MDANTDSALSTTFAALTAEDGGQYQPFRWQTRLLHRFLKNDLPKLVDVPTGLGKTSVMALWLIALAEGVNLPRRLVYVVDRRAVVDQATRFAERLRFNMLPELARKLGLKDSGLPISTLRGGFADNRDWLEDPSKPAIVVGTIDMVGSRLLFEGYGVSRKMRPYHAGLLGVDALVLLDEAHLCPPFEELLRQVEEQRDGRLGPKAGDSVTPPFRLMSLSATGRKITNIPPEAIFQLEPQDRLEPLVEQRLKAHKQLRVQELTDPKNLTEQLAESALELGAGATPARVLVYCHSRKDAVEVKTLIDKQCKNRLKSGELAEKHQSELLVGERRVYERKALESWLDDNGLLGGVDSPPNTPTFLVATSAGEVGVDLSADHMVCDLVAYERMVQRLGRVNRRGGEGRQAKVEVFAVRPQVKASASKKEEAERDLDTFKRRLSPLCRLPQGEDDRHDASPAALVDLKSSHAASIDAATTLAPLYPQLTRPLVDAWSMTSLKHHEGRPEVAPWLRGWDQDEKAQTSVVWRRHLPHVCTDSESKVPPTMVAQFFHAAPVLATERLEAASDHVFDWLLKRATQVNKRSEDHELTIEANEIVAILIDHAGEHIADMKLSDATWLGKPAKDLDKREQRQRDGKKREWRERRLPGATLVVDARLGGLRDGMLDEKSETETIAADADESWRKETDTASEKSRPLIRFRVEEVTDIADGEGLKSPTELDEWRHIWTFETHFSAGGVAHRGLAVFKWPDDAEDEDARSVLSEPQLLHEHAADVEACARDLSTSLKLPDEEVEALAVAARLHDDGKAAARWQNAMNAPKDGCVYAKTKGGGNWRLLEGYRHEFGSLLKAESEDLPDDTRDLILHLIAAHHGNARPLISSTGCEDGPPSTLEKKAGDAALRFVRLQQRYGPWGLAWREAILRAADQKASRAWSERHRESRDG